MSFYHLSYSKSVVFMPYFPYIEIVNKTSYNISVLMIPKVKVLGVEKKNADDMITYLFVLRKISGVKPGLCDKMRKIGSF